MNRYGTIAEFLFDYFFVDDIAPACPKCCIDVDHILFDQYRCPDCGVLWTIQIIDDEQLSFETPTL